MLRLKTSFCIALLVVFTGRLLIDAPELQASIWNNIAGGSWAVPGNWDSIPNAPDATADFSTLDITSDAIVTLDGNFTVGSLLFGDTSASNNWIINAGSPVGTLTLAVSSGSPTINVVNQTATINAVLAGNQGLTKIGNGTLTLSATNTFTGGVTLNAGQLNINAASALGPAAGMFTINGGTINNTTAGAITTVNYPQTWGGDFTFLGSQNLNLGTGLVSLGANAGAARTITTTAGTLTVGGIISNGTNGTTPTTAITKAGNGTLTLTGANTFSGGITINAGTVRATSNAKAPGTGTTTVNAGTTLVVGAALTNPIVLSGGTMGFTGTASLAGSLTLTPATTSTIESFDPLVPGTSVNESFTGSLLGSGNINILNATGVTSVDGTQAFRINGANTSSYSGTITLFNNVKGELFGTTTGVTTPAGTGKIVMTAGDAAFGQTLNALTTTGGYTELNLRDNLGNQIYGNDVQVIGNGLAVINPLGTAAAGSTITMGNLTTGANQQVAVYLASGATAKNVIFQTVTLTGNATFVPKSGTFGLANQVGSDLTLTNISEQNAGTSITMNGLRTLFLAGNNSFTGGVIINSGVVQLNGTGALNATSPNAVTFGASAAAGTLLRLAGNSVTISGLNTNATAGSPAVENASANPATLTISTSGTSTFAGVLQNGTGGGALSLAKTGTGTQILSGANTYTGATNVLNGTLALGSGGSLPSATTLTLGDGNLNTSGTFDLAGSSTTVAGLSVSGTGTSNTIGNSSISSSSTLTVNGGTSTFAGRIQNTLLSGNQTVALSVGGGSLKLTGNNTYSGDTNIGNGTLLVTGSLATTGNVNVNNAGVLGGAGNGSSTGRVGNVTLQSGGSIRPGALATDNSIGTLAMSSLTVNGGDMRLDVGGSSDAVKVLGAATFNGASTITSTTVPAAGSYVVLTATSLSGTAPTAGSAAPGTTRATESIDFGVSTPNTIKLVVTGTPKTLTWTGAGSPGTVWDLVTTQNWSDNGGVTTNEKFFNFDAVVFGDGPANRNVTLTGTLTPSTVTVNNSAGNDYVFSGDPIADSGLVGGTSLTKSGTGTLTMSNLNTYAGPTAVKNGKLVLGSSLALPNNTSLSLGDSGTNSSGIVDLNGNNAVVTSLSTSGTGTANLIGNSSTIVPSTLTVSGGTSTFAGTIQDSLSGGTQTVSLAVTGGSLTLSGSNTYTGGTTISTGTIVAGSSTALGAATGALTMSTAGTLDLHGNSISVGVLTGDNTSVINSSVAGAANLTSAGASDSTFAGQINNGSGTVGVVKSGNGTLTLSGVSTYSGGLSVNSGAVRLTNVSAAGAGTITVNTNGTMVYGAVVTNPVTLAGGTLGTAVALNPVAADVTASPATTSTIVLADPQNLPIGTADISEVNITGNLHGSGNINIQSNGQDDNPDSGNGFRLRGTGASDFSGTITFGSNIKGEIQASNPGSFSPAGTGKFVLTAGAANLGNVTTAPATTGYTEFNVRNNSTGDVVFGNNVEIAGTGLALMNPLGTAPVGAKVTMGNLKIGSGQELGLYLANGSNPHVIVFPTVTLNGSATFSPRHPTFGATNSVGSDLSLGNISELVAGSGVTMNGTRTLFLTGNNTFTGGLTINNGLVQLGNAGALNSTTPNVVTFDASAPANTTLQLNGNSVTGGGLDSASTNAIVENASATPTTFTVKRNSTSTFAGVLRDGTGGGALSLMTDGTGTLIISNNLTYTGNTTINGGSTLQIGNGTASGSINNTSSIGGANGTLAFNRSDNLDFSQAIGGSVGVAKNLSNTLTLSGANSYTGTTNINNGTLVVSGSLANTGAVHLVNAGAALAGNGNGTSTGTVGNVTTETGTFVRPGVTGADGNIGTLTMKSLSVNGGEFHFDITSTSVHDLVAVTTNANFAAGSTSNFTPIFTGSPAQGSYTLLTANNLSIGSGATLNLNTPSSDSRLVFNLVPTPGSLGTIVLNVTGNAANLIWTGAQTNDWDLKNHANWSGASPNQYFELDNVTFNDSSNVSTHNVNLASTFTPGSVTVAANTNYSFNGGGITGSGGLTKSGSGTLTLGSNDSYTGATSVQNGTLILANSNALPNNSNLVVGSNANSGIVDLNGNSITLASLSTSGTGSGNLIRNTGSGATITVNGGTNVFSGSIQESSSFGISLSVTAGSLAVSNTSYSGQTTISSGATLQIGTGASGSIGATTITNDGSLNFNLANTVTVSGTINGAGTVQTLGSGTVKLAANNTYSGITTIGGGTLQIGDPAANAGTTGSLGNGNVTNNGTLVFNRSDAITVANVISGLGGVQHAGAGTTTLSAANTFFGGLIANNGTVRLTNASAAGDASGTIVINPAGTVVVGVAIGNPITLAGGTLGAIGLAVNNTIFLTTGDITAQAATTSTVRIGDPQNVATASDVRLSGTLHGSGNISVVSDQGNADGGAGFRLQGTGASDFSGIITLGNSVKGELQTSVAGPFTPAGTGKIQLTGGSTPSGSLNGTYSELNLRDNFSGNTVFGTDVEFIGAGFANINPIGSVSAAGSVLTLGNLKIGANQILGVNRNTGTALTAAFQSVTLTGGDATFSPITAGATWSQTTGMNISLGPISESVAGSGIIAAGTSTVLLTGVNSYTGATTVNSGTLQLGGTERINNGSNLVMGGGIFNAAGFSETMAKLRLNAGSTSGTPSVIDFGTSATNTTLTFASSSDFGSVWASGSLLQIKDWDQVGHTDHIYVGTNPAGQGNSGLSHAQLNSIQFIFSDQSVHTASLGANGELLPDLVPPALLTTGDIDQNGSINGTDLSTLEQLLTTNFSAYETLHNFTEGDVVSVLDVNRDGLVNNADIQGEIYLLIHGSLPGPNPAPATVPEPTSFLLLGLGGAIYMSWVSARIRRNRCS